MSKAGLLSACGDPFISLFAIKLWKERWYSEIDKLYIDYNNNAKVPQEVVSEFLSRVSQDPKVHIIYHPNGIGNGMPITEMTLISKEDLVMLLEDDGFIFESGKVDECFKRIESGEVDAIGSPRGSCGKEIWDGMQKKYNLDYSGYGDQGPNYWPNFFFCKRTDLLKTDMNFGSKHFPKGVYFKEIDHTFVEDNYGDTFVWADIQMRYNGVRFGHVAQYHANPFDIEYYENYTNMWQKPNEVKWIHGGSLSAGWGGYLSGRVPDVSSDSSKQEIESRVAFWKIAVGEIWGFGDFREKYEEGISTLIFNAKLDKNRVAKKIEIYKKLMKI